MEHEYTIKISLTKHIHDNYQKPFYWSLSKHEDVWSQIAFGWEDSPQNCFQSALHCYHELTVKTQNKDTIF